MAYYSTQQNSPYRSAQQSPYRYARPYANDYLHERNVENVKDERKVRLMEQTQAEQDLQRAKLQGQDQRVPVLEGNLQEAQERRRRNSLKLEQTVQNQQNDPQRSTYGYGYYNSDLNKNLADSKTQNIKSQMDLNEKSRQNYGYPYTTRPYYSSYDDMYTPAYSRYSQNPQQSRYGSVNPYSTYNYADRSLHSGQYSPSKYYSQYSPSRYGYGAYGAGAYGAYGAGAYGTYGAYGGYGASVDRMHERNIDNIKDKRVVRLEQQNLAQKQQNQAERRQESVESYDPQIDNEVNVLEKKLEIAKENRRRNSLRVENEVQQQQNEPFRGGYTYGSYGVNSMLAKNKSDTIKQSIEKTVNPGNDENN